MNIPKGEQMKRTGFLMEKICTRENALQAIFEINKERRRNKTAQWVEQTKEKRALGLCKIVRDFQPKPSRTFTRYDPAAGKTRIIKETALWPDQYIHHMIVQTLKPLLMRDIDYYCCGSIPDLGPHRAKRAIEKWLDKDRKGTKYAVEADIRKYYDIFVPFTQEQTDKRSIYDCIIGNLIRTAREGGFYYE